MRAEGQVGPQFAADGTALNPLRMARDSSVVVQDAHAKFQEAVYRGNCYTFGSSSTALVAANAIATGVTATAQPVIGLWNPNGSGVNLVIWRALIGTTVVAASAVAPGGFMWLSSFGQSAITTGSTGFNCLTLQQVGSKGKAFSLGTALTGMTGSLSTVRASIIQSINAAGPSTVVPQPVTAVEELVDGMFIVPPGGVLVLMNALSTTTISVNTGIVWEEIPL